MNLVSDIGEIIVQPSSKKDQCGICGRKTMANSALCKCCGNWINARFTKIKMVTNRLAIDYKCRKCKVCHNSVD